jgi:hypothetical protein
VDLAGLEVRLAALKDDFESSVLGEKEAPQSVRQANSWKTMSLTLAAAVSALEPERYGDRFELKQTEVEKIWKDKNLTWDHKAIYAMRFCDESLTRLTVILADRRQNNEVLTEFQSLMTLHGVDSTKAIAEPAQLAETKVFWSNRLVALFPLVIKTVAVSSASELDDIVEDLLNRAEIIASRRDIHYQARMELLYLNNVQSLANMFFLLATLPESSIREAAADIKNEWELSMRDQDLMVALKVSLSLIAATQMSFNLSLWYVTGKKTK